VLEFPYTAANADQTPVAGGLTGYYNVGGGIFDHNVFAGTVTSDTNKCYAGIWSQNGTVSFTNNYIVDGAADMINRVGNGDSAVDVLADGYEFLFEGVDADFLAALNTSTGVEVFGMTGDMLMHKDTIDVYGRIALDADDFIDSSITETDAPVTSAPESSDTTEAPDTSDTTVESTEESTAESTEESTAESTEESTAESTEESTAESTEETTAESTEESTVESTVETTEPEEVTTEEETTSAKTEAPGTDATTTTAPADEGCGSVITASVALVAMALIAPAALVLKKKDNE